jgi:hypothetical protein
MRRRTWTAWLAGALLATGPALAGTVIETDSEQQGLNRMLVSGDQIRMESGGRVMLFDASASEMTFVMPDQKQYQVMTREDMQKVARQMKQMREQMEQQLQNVPEGQREQMRQQMQQMMPGMGPRPEIRVEATGKTAEVAGATCRQARIYRDDQPAHQVCVAEPGALGIPSGDFDTIMAMFGFFDEMAGAMGGGGDVGAREMRQMMEELGGMPARARSLQQGDSWHIRRVESRSIDASQFEVPDGYSEAEGMGQMQ